jgi:chorismate dehydratase
VHRLRIAAIDFLNPAPLMWNFEHPPEAERLRTRYSIHKMTPAECAQQLRAGDADIGLIPIAAYATIPGLAIVPGCTIASLGAIRSILLIVRATGDFQPDDRHAAIPPSSLFSRHPAPASATDPDLVTPAALHDLRQVETVALDTASRTSAMYTRILFARYWQHCPRCVPHAADLDAMLATADAALLIGDPALHALEHRQARQKRTGERLHYLDLGAAWRAQTGLPWVSAFWAVRSQSLASPEAARHLTADCIASRDAGLAHIPALAEQWCASLHLPRQTIETYLGHNIHYLLDDPCLRGIAGFYEDAASCELISQPPPLVFL